MNPTNSPIRNPIVVSAPLRGKFNRQVGSACAGFVMSKHFIRGLAIAIALCVGACSNGPNRQPVSAEELQSMTAASAATPLLQRGDKIRVTVYGEDKIGGDYEIDPGGFVTLPLTGPLQAAGLTRIAFQRVLTQKLRSEYLKNPQVSIDVVAFRPIYVMGEVERPGEYPFKGGLNIVSATALAGGVTYRGNRSTVLIQHSDETAPKEYPLVSTVPIFPGDIIQVPERFF
jgi:polysaccharide export outer membrane protein